MVTDVSETVSTLQCVQMLNHPETSILYVSYTLKGGKKKSGLYSTKTIFCVCEGKERNGVTASNRWGVRFIETCFQWKK